MVAKSYQGLPQVCSPYDKGDHSKMYVKVQMKNGNIKEVRWYYDPVTLESLQKARFGVAEDGTLNHTIYLTPDISMEEGINENLVSKGGRWREGIGWYWINYHQLMNANLKPRPRIVPYTWEEELKFIKKEGIYNELLPN